MSTKKIIIAVVVLALGLSAFSLANAQSPGGPLAGVSQTADGGPSFFHRGPQGPRGERVGPLAGYIKEAAAEILGVSVEDLEAARQNGTSMQALFDEAGLTAEEFRAAMEEALPGILEQAVADEVITQAQADTILDNGLRIGGFKGPRGEGPLHEYMQQAAAEILGMSVEDLQAAKDEGLRRTDLLEEAGLTEEAFKEAMEEALPGILDQAVEDGVITQDQADTILENGFPGPHHHHHRGPRGRNNCFGPGGSEGNGTEAPAFFGGNNG